MPLFRERDGALCQPRSLDACLEHILLARCPDSVASLGHTDESSQYVTVAAYDRESLVDERELIVGVLDLSDDLACGRIK